MTDKAHFQRGTQTKIAAIFSCPGKKEQQNGKPVSGKTGENLKIVLQEMFKTGKLTDNLSKDDLRITNAWDKVLYKKKNGGTNGATEGKLNKTEIYSDKNIKRLNKELSDISDIIICFGYKAQKSIEKLSLSNNPKILKAPHLSLQCINRLKSLKTDIYGKKIQNGKNANLLRIQKIVHHM